MSGVRIYDLAKELNLPSNDLIKIIHDLGGSAKVPSNSITDEAAESVRLLVTSTMAVANSGNGAAPADGSSQTLPGNQPESRLMPGPPLPGQKVGGETASRPATTVSQLSQRPFVHGTNPSNATRPSAPSTGAVLEDRRIRPAAQPSPQATTPQAGVSPRAVSPVGMAPGTGSGTGASDDTAGKVVEVPDIVSLKDFAELIGVPPPTIQKKLMGLGVLASLSQKLSPEVVTRLAKSYGVIVKIVPVAGQKPTAAPVPGVPAPPAALAPVVPKVTVVAAKPRQKPAGPVSRPPVVTIMGHVDHGKTTLLDALRNSQVAAGEFGGITQHIGAYQVEIDDPGNPGAKRKITFLDTPGHEAFTAMRARGAQLTDIAVLVVAADDGVMPQTIEAIQHAKAAQVPIIVAINKIDKEGADPTRVLTQLTGYDVMPEAYGGDVQTVELSAKQGLGLDDLLERIILVSDAEVDPKADPTAPSVGTVIEAELDKGRGAVVTLLVEQGTLKMGDAVVAGTGYGRVRAMFDEHGSKVLKAEPARPVVILGLGTTPNAGDRFEVVKDEKTARMIAALRFADERTDRLAARRAVTLEDLQRQIKDGATKELKLIIKGDVQGSVEAIRQSLEKIQHPEVRVRFIASGVGGVGESDILLASASDALVVAFNVKADAATMRLAEKEHIDVREYKVIYDLIDDVKAAMAGLLDPIYEEIPLGIAEVRMIFKLPKAGGAVAGSYIVEGKVARGAGVRVKRNNKVVFEGKIESLKREKDDAREVAQGFECGIVVPGYDPVEGDLLACFELKRIERTLN